MTDTTLERIRTVLRNLQAQKVDEARDTADMDGALGAITMGEKAGEHKVAARLLKELPEPECEAVKSYRAAEQLLDAEIDLEEQYPRMGMEPDQLLHKIAHTKRVEAIEAVKDRIEEREDPDGRPYLYDPVSKTKFRNWFGGESEHEDISREQLAQEVIQE